METDIKIKPCKKIETFNSKKEPNGWLLELISDRDGFTKELRGQVYLTVARPGQFKGFHLHAAADYFVTCVKGKIKHIIYTGFGGCCEIEMGDGDFKTVFLPKGFPHGLENTGDEDAYVIIYRYPSWSPEFKEQFDISLEEIETKEVWEKINSFNEKFKLENEKNRIKF